MTEHMVVVFGCNMKTGYRVSIIDMQTRVTLSIYKTRVGMNN